MESNVPPEIATYSILAVFDVKSIMGNSGNYSKDPENPTVLTDADKKIFFVIKRAAEIGASFANKLEFIAKKADVLMWRSTGLSGISGFGVQWYKYQVVSGDNLISTPSLHLHEVNLPVVNPSDPLNPKKYQAITEYCWSTEVCGNA